MQCGQLILPVVVVVASLVRPVHAQTEPSLPEAAALFDTAVARLVDLELAIIHSHAQDRSSPHADVTVPRRQIASLRELLATLSDTAEVNAAVQIHLMRALQARLASILVTQRLVAIRQDPSQPSSYTLRREEELLRARLRDLDAAQHQ